MPHVELPYDHERAMRQRQRDWERNKRTRQLCDSKRRACEEMVLAKKAMLDGKDKILQSARHSFRISLLPMQDKGSYLIHHEEILKGYNRSIEEFRQTVATVMILSAGAIKERKAEISEWKDEHKARCEELLKGHQRWERRDKDTQSVQNHKNTMAQLYRKTATAAMADLVDVIKAKEATLVCMTTKYDRDSVQLASEALEHRLLSIEWRHPLT